MNCSRPVAAIAQQHQWRADTSRSQLNQMNEEHYQHNARTLLF
jgi:hypothetical protein